MPGQPRAALIGRLRDTIATIEARAPLPRARQRVDATPFARLPEDGLHEVFVSGFPGAAPGLAFALGHAAARVRAGRQAIFWLQIEHEAQETGLPYAPGLAAFGLAPDDLVLIRTRTVAELLWAAEEAVSCAAVAGVVADMLAPAKILDFTASRRLALRAGASGVPIFLLRYGEGREASAARTRWHIAPAPSAAHPYDAAAPGAARWLATLEKAPQGQSGSWRLAWTGSHFTQAPDQPQPLLNHDTPGPVPNGAAPKGPALSGSHLPALGHRLPETG